MNLPDLWLTHEPWRIGLAAGTATAFALLCLQARRRSSSDITDDTLLDHLVFYASQTGQAEEIARRTNKRLSGGERAARLLSLGQATPTLLENARHILCVVSTTGQGDAPDEARAFEAKWMARPLDLAGRDFAVLALGDRRYDDFCAFGHRVHDWLESCGATAAMPCVEVDDLDAVALNRWEDALTQWGAAELTAENPYTPWILQSRERLNPDSEAAGLYRLRLVAEGPLPSWQAGDLAEITTPGGHRRDYSIASLPSEGHLALYVRAVAKAPGQLGEGSGLLIENLAVGGTTGLRIKSHPSFHSPPGSGPVLLIGAGSGLAGLRAHVLAFRTRRPCRLIYGERHPKADARILEDIPAWLTSGSGSGFALDLAFSQPDEGVGQYVQDVLREKAEGVRSYLSTDGAIMVCGGLDMGLAVDAILRRTLGAEWLNGALAGGRYRRDLY